MSSVAVNVINIQVPNRKSSKALCWEPERLTRHPIKIRFALLGFGMSRTDPKFLEVIDPAAALDFRFFLGGCSTLTASMQNAKGFSCSIFSEDKL